ncbi:MAG: HAD hydrolase-like protein [Lachnospiraceae bacterium]|jgi:phosphoglycolate phosphatase|nr:HAD hydrolase-like protein [Lachnospiraceae bacterium]
MDKRYILFDLDGTLTDSYEGIINAFRYALRHMEIEPRPETFRNCIGPPVTWSLQTFYGMDDTQADEGLRLFREYYDSRGLYENRPYNGIEEMLQVLNAHGKKLMVATAKPEHMAIRVLEHFGLADYFCFIAGINQDRSSPVDDPASRATKEEVIRYVLRTNGILDPENAVMVGDRGGDIRAARQFGLQTLGVTYGYGTEDELRSAGADHLAETPERVAEIIVLS